MQWASTPRAPAPQAFPPACAARSQRECQPVGLSPRKSSPMINQMQIAARLRLEGTMPDRKEAPESGEPTPAFCAHERRHLRCRLRRCPPPPPWHGPRRVAAPPVPLTSGSCHSDLAQLVSISQSVDPVCSSCHRPRSAVKRRPPLPQPFRCASLVSASSRCLRLSACATTDEQAKLPKRRG